MDFNHYLKGRYQITAFSSSSEQNFHIFVNIRILARSQVVAKTNPPKIILTIMTFMSNQNIHGFVRIYISFQFILKIAIKLIFEKCSNRGQQWNKMLLIYASIGPTLVLSIPVFRFWMLFSKHISTTEKYPVPNTYDTTKIGFKPVFITK